MAKKTRARTGRRVRERAARELVRDRQKLAALLPGGAPERPIEVPSAAVVPVRARATPCPLCDGAFVIEHESAGSREGRLVHAVHVACARCGVARTLWFHVVPSLPS
ncbi:MAG TPA: hypothetical protein VF997_21515 [Polyangia bacterium]